MKVHCHSEQFDGAMHATCGRVTSQPTGTKRIVNNAVFSATDPGTRCFFCDRDWFPKGQPKWHLEASKKFLKEKRES